MTLRLNKKQIILLGVLFLAMYYMYKSSQEVSIQYPSILKTSIDSSFTIRPL